MRNITVLGLIIYTGIWLVPVQDVLARDVITKVPIFTAMKARMDYLNQQQSVISHNIANANTPGYKAREMKPVDFNKLAKSRHSKLKIFTTSPTHMRGSKSGRSLYQTRKIRDTFETTPVGNNVVLEEEMMKLATGSTDYNETTNVYRKMIGMVKTAISNR